MSLDRQEIHDLAGMNDDWPTGRGVFVDDSYNFVLLVNFEDHVQVVTTAKDGDISKCI